MDTSTREVYSTLQSVIEAIQKSKKMIIITGAGISVSCGIPDFRSKEVGLYNHLDCKKINIPSAELLFDLEFFTIDPKPFYSFFPMLLLEPNIEPSPSHKFIYLMQENHKLLRNYTQNIDNLEKKVGIKSSKLIECHGSIETFQCVCCRKKCTLYDVIDFVKNSQVPYCIRCNDEVMKPCITFFGETVPTKFTTAIKKDLEVVDLILIIGTSLKVGGSVHQLLRDADGNIPQILINRDLVTLPKNVSNGFNAVLLGDCDQILSYISFCIDLSSEIDEKILFDTTGEGIFNFGQLDHGESAVDMKSKLFSSKLKKRKCKDIIIDSVKHEIILKPKKSKRKDISIDSNKKFKFSN